MDDADDLWLHAVLDVPASSHATAATFWSACLGWPAGDPWPGHDELSSFTPPDGAAYVHLQRIDGAPRVHVDLAVPTARQAARRVEAAVALGARSVGREERWTAMRSPGGLPFCVVASHDVDPPAEVTWPGGHRTRLVQVCIDAPAGAVEREVHFWRALLGGRWVGSQSAEFVGKWHRDGSPLQLLFQRLDEHDGPVRAHLDLGADDVGSEVERLRGLGAADVGEGRGWHVLRDPAGQSFCVTGNRPEGVHDRDLG